MRDDSVTSIRICVVAEIGDRHNDGVVEGGQCSRGVDAGKLWWGGRRSISLTRKISNSAACTTLRRPLYLSPNVDLGKYRPRPTYTHRTLIECMNRKVYLYVCV